MLDLKVKQFIIATVILCFCCYFHFYLLGFFFWTFGFVVFEDSLDVSDDGEDEEFDVFFIDPGNEFDLIEFKAQMRGFRIDDYNDKKWETIFYWQNIKITSRFYGFYGFCDLMYGSVDPNESVISIDNTKFHDFQLELACSTILEKKLKYVCTNLKKKEKGKKALTNKYFY